MATSTINGTRLNYEVGGPAGAPCVVLSNSLLTDLSMWEPQWPALTSRYRVLRYDTRGHGASEVGQTPFTMEGLADDLVGLMDAVGMTDAHFVGLSLGGMIAQTLAVRAPRRVRSLCLVATTSLRPSHGPAVWLERIRTVRADGNYDRLLSGIYDRWVSMRFRRTQPEDFARLRAMIVNTPIEGYVGCCEAIAGYDIRSRLGEITTPCLVIVGEEDSGTPLEDARIIASGIAGARLEMIAYYRHMLNWEARETFGGLLHDWLAAQAR